CGAHLVVSIALFFFQAEDGIRDFHVTGVQTCALPICSKVAISSPTIRLYAPPLPVTRRMPPLPSTISAPCSAAARPSTAAGSPKIGRASWRETLSKEVDDERYKKQQ